MIIKRIELLNFKQYASVVLDDLQEGLYGIFGPNGAGKSTLFDAILFALYCDKAIEKEYIRYDKAGEKEPVKVMLDFEVNGALYRIKREYRGKNLTLTSHLLKIGQTEKTIAEDTDAVEEEIRKLTGFNKQDFKKTIFTRQSELKILAEDSPEPRKKFIRNMIGGEKIDTALSLLREDVRRIKTVIDTCEKRLLTDGQIKEMKEGKTKITVGLENMNREKAKIIKEIEKTDSELRKLKAELVTLDNLKSKDEQFERQIIKFSEQSSSTEDRIKTLEKELSHLKNDEKRLPELKKSYDEFQDLKIEEKNLINLREKDIRKKNNEKNKERLLKEISRLNEKQKKLSLELRKEKEYSENLSRITKEISEITIKIKKIDKDIKAGENKKGGIKQELEKTSKQLEVILKTGESADCPTCTRPLKDVYNDIVKKFEKEKKDLISSRIKITQIIDNKTREKEDLETKKENSEEKRNKFNSNLEVLKDKKDSFKSLQDDRKEKEEELQEAKELLLALKDIAFDEKKLKQVETKLENLEKKAKDYEVIKDRIKAIPKKTEEKENSQSKIDTLRKQVSGLKKEKTGLKYDAEKHTEIKQRREDVDNEYKNNMYKRNENEKEIINAKNEIKNIEKELKRDKEMKKDIEENKKNLVLHEQASAIMDEFKNYIVNAIRPQVSRYASRLFSDATNGKYPEIRVTEDFCFEIFDDSKYYDIKRFSGGERDLAAFCIRIAVSKVIAEISAGQMEFLAFDEIFGSQDDERKQNIMNLIVNTLQSQFKQIFVITHIADVKDEFTRRIEVTYTPNGSKTTIIQ